MDKTKVTSIRLLLESETYYGGALNQVPEATSISSYINFAATDLIIETEDDKDCDVHIVGLNLNLLNGMKGLMFGSLH